jgi:hypothetical protein
LVSLSVYNPLFVHTIAPTPYCRIQCGNKVGHDGVGIVQTGEDRYDVGAGIGVLLGEGGIEEDCQGLSGKRMEKVSTWAARYLEGDFVGGRFGLLDAEDGLAEQLLRMRLLVEHLVGRYRGEDALQAGRIGSVEEELVPEAFGDVDIVIVFLRRISTLLAQG